MGLSILEHESVVPPDYENRKFPGMSVSNQKHKTFRFRVLLLRCVPNGKDGVIFTCFILILFRTCVYPG